MGEWGGGGVRGRCTRRKVCLPGGEGYLVSSLHIRLRLGQGLVFRYVPVFFVLRLLVVVVVAPSPPPRLFPALFLLDSSILCRSYYFLLFFPLVHVLVFCVPVFLVFLSL